MRFFKKARYGSLKDETSLKMIQQKLIFLLNYSIYQSIYQITVEQVKE